jgi:hypothetical protein
MSVDEICDAIMDFVGEDGFFKDLLAIDPTGRKRVIAMLLVKQRTGEIEYDASSEKWAIKAANGVSTPAKGSGGLRSSKMSEMTVSELYRIVFPGPGIMTECEESNASLTEE